MENEVQAGTLTHREPGDRRKPTIIVLHFNSDYFNISESITLFLFYENILCFDFRWQPRAA